MKKAQEEYLYDEGEMLRPCPFCGSKGEHQANGGDHWVFCRCGGYGPTAKSRVDAVKAWNNRA